MGILLLVVTSALSAVMEASTSVDFRTRLGSVTRYEAVADLNGANWEVRGEFSIYLVNLIVVIFPCSQIVRWSLFGW